MRATERRRDAKVVARTNGRMLTYLLAPLVLAGPLLDPDGPRGWHFLVSVPAAAALALAGRASIRWDEPGGEPGPTRNPWTGVRACGVGLAVVYAVAVPLKGAGLMPDHVTWTGLAVGPAAVVGPVVAALAGVAWLGRRWWQLFAPVAVLSATALLGLNIVRLGG